jgi:hypothetical protein
MLILNLPYPGESPLGLLMQPVVERRYEINIY